MAKKTVLTYLRELAGATPATGKRDAQDLNIEQPTSISTTERDKFLAQIGTPEVPKSRQKNVDGSSLEQYLSPIAKQISKNRHDHQMIMSLAPEVGQAATIVVPSIISPSALDDQNLQFFLDTDQISDAQKDKIVALLDEHFNGELKISEKLPEWIEKTLYFSGSTPLMILPLSELDQIANDDRSLIVGTEAYGEYHKTMNESLFGLATATEEYTPAEECLVAVESALAEHLQPTETHTSRSQNSDSAGSYNRSERITALQNVAKVIFAKEAFGIVDNPDVLKQPEITNRRKTKMERAALDKKFKPVPFQPIKADPSAQVTGNPILMELPPESVAPIFAPGKPHEHLGYIITIDAHGAPVTLRGADTEENPKNVPNTSRLTIPELYKAFGYTMPSNTQRQEQVMADLYSRIVDSYLKDRFKQKGFGDISIGSDNTVYQCMLARFLQAKQTRLLYVPKELLTYFCYKYNEDGTGRSKLEDIKFILSLRISLLLCRYLSAFNDAIQRKKLEVTFDENMPIGDPQQFLRDLEQSAIEKSMVSISWRPQDVMRQIATKSLSVSAKGYPGAENFEISNENMQTQSTTPDEALSEDIRKMLIIWLDVPPSVYNSLDDAEFSRSVAVINLFFARKITLWQKITCKHMGDACRTYTAYSEPLRNKIAAILSMDTDDINDGTGTTGKTDSSELLQTVVASIRTSLPSPNIAPDKTQFDEIEAFVQSAESIVQAMYSDDLFGNDRDTGESLTAIRAYVKSNMVREHLNQIGILSRVNIPTMEDLDLPGLLQLHREVLNAANGMKTQKANLTAPDTSADGTGGGSDSSGGAPSGGGGGGFSF